jgi:general secretion pathway protein L
MELDFIQDRQPALETLAAGWAQGPTIDLLQGAYSRREEWGRMLRPWKATAALFVTAVLVSLVSAGLNYYRLSDRQAKLSAEIEAVYRSAFPGSRRVVDPRAQMEQQLTQLRRGSGGGNTDFLPLLAETAKILRATQGVNVRGASYRDGRLDLDLQADSLQILDGLKQALSGGGQMQAEIQSATTDAEQKVNSRIRVQGVGS